MVHESTSLPPSQIWDSALRVNKDYKGALSPSIQQQSTSGHCWTPPPPPPTPQGFHKVNVVKASSDDGKPSGIGAIIRDSNGQVIAANCNSLPAHYPANTVEAIALEKGIILAQEMNIPQVIPESDALSIVQYVKTTETNGTIGHIFQGILDSLFSFKS